MSRKILVVDDEPNIRLSMRYGLLSDEWEIEEAASGNEAVTKAQQTRYDLMLLDLRMPGLDGLQVLQKLNECKVRLPAVLVSAYATTDTVLQAIRLGTLDFLTKPVTPEQVRMAIREVLARFDFAGTWRAAPSMTLSNDEKLQVAKLCVFERQYAQAEKLFQELTGTPHQEEALLLLGILCEITGNFTEAEDHYMKAIQPEGIPTQASKNLRHTRSLFKHLSGG